VVHSVAPVLLLVDVRGCCRAGGEIHNAVSSVYF
jgi:hypothetical protein